MPLDAGPPPDFIPDEEAQASPPDFIPDQHPDAVAASGKAAPPAFIPDAKFVPDSETYGSPGQQALAGAEGFARGVTLGGSDVAERALGLSTPEAMRGRKEANPWTSGLSSVAGGAALGVATGGGGLAAEALGGGALAGAVGLGAEGAVFGAGNAVSDAALGDPDLNGQKVLSHIGWGAALGAGLGTIAGKLGAFAPKALEAAAEDAEGAGASLVDYPPTKGAAPPKSLDELNERLAKAKTLGIAYELPQKAVLQKAISELPDLELPPIPQQVEALNSKGDLDEFRIAFREGDSSAARAVQNLEGAQKAELVQKTSQTIESLSPNAAPAEDAVVGGNRAIEAFTEQYQKVKKALVPMFQALDKVDLGPLRADIMPLMESLSNKIPSVARMFEYGEGGELKGVNSFDPKWGLSRAAYNSVKGVYESLEAGAEDSASFQDLLNLRGALDEHVNILAKDQGPAQIRGLKAAFMDYLQNLADDHIPDANLRETFKRYAINEQNRQVIERTFGANVGAQDLSFMPKNASEDILGKIFRDTETVKAAKRILDPAKFDELLASHLAIVKNGFTKNGVFSSNHFLNYLRRHAPELGEAFSDRPDILNRLKNLSTVSTIIPDSASVNPSGSAKTFMGLLKNELGGMSLGEVGIGALNPKVLAGLIGKRAFSAIMDLRSDRAITREFNAGLMGKAAKQQGLEATQKILGAVNANLDRAAKSIFRIEEPEHAR